ncbi:putative membrane protein YcfT [Mycetocola sp. CAN_C7]|uniref:acyltransferase family protein n=1 Tax=Mycetocola sp. CAN_C7 TaxID=2787724 RepID=UPI0018CB4EE0
MDVAKAGAIILVVVFHVAGAAVAFLLPGADDVWLRAWKALSTFLIPVRMPLFFLMSGVLAASAVQRPWPTLFRSRYANLLWPYLLWSVAFSVVFGCAVSPENWWPTTATSLATIVQGGDAYWFLPSLVVFFTLARVFRSVSPALLFVAFLAWLVIPLTQPLLTEFLPDGLATNIGRWCSFALWFLLGCFGRTLVNRVAALPWFPLLPLAAGSYALMAYFYYVADNRDLPWTIGLNVCGLLSAVQLAVVLSASPRIAAVSGYIARRTLPIYLLHPLIVYSIVALSQVAGNPLRLPTDSSVLNFLFVPVLTAALVWASMVLYDGALRGPLRVLFVPPGGRRSARPHDDSAARPKPV